MFEQLNILDWNTGVWKFILRLFVSILCGVVIGYERKTRSKEAGIRTHSIVCMAAALFMILSKYAYVDLVNIAGSADADPSRIASTVVTGIGFLGAGIIIYKRDVMHGLTTAAGIWATAAIGMAIGAGFYIIGICATVFLVLLQFVFHLPIKAFASQHLSLIKMVILLDTDEAFQTIKEGLSIKKILGYDVKYVDGKMIATFEFVTARTYSVEELNKILRDNPEHIISIERNEEL